MGIHQPPKAHSQLTIQSEIMSPYLFPTRETTVPFTFFHFSELFAYSVPLNASLRARFSQN